MRKKRMFLFISSVILFVAALWFLMWIFSSASLASGYCNSEFSIFHEEFRCRQPYIALIGFVVTGLFAVLALVLGILDLKKQRMVTRKKND